MNIMEVISGTTVNGAIQHCLLLTRELALRGNRLTLVCQPGSWIAGQAAQLPVEVVTSDLHRWPTDELRRIATVAQERRIDVVHTHMSRAHFFGVLLRWFCDVPCVATAHSRLFQLHWMFNDLVIAVSDATRRFHQRINRVSPRRIVTIHNFIDERRQALVAVDARRQARAALGIEDSTFLLGSVGDVIPRKGALYLVRALPKILDHYPNAMLALVGADGPPTYMEKIEATAERLGVTSRILRLGRRPDVLELLPAMDLWVLPSLEESLPLALLEAMSAGLPVVASAVGGIPECVVHGENGLLVPPADVERLADAILRLMDDDSLRCAMSTMARRWVHDQFSLTGQTLRIESALAAVARHAA